MVGIAAAGSSARRCLCHVRPVRSTFRSVHASSSRRQDAKPKFEPGEIPMSHAGRHPAAEPEPGTSRPALDEPTSSRPASSSDKLAWQLPAAWRSQLDPNAPWRKSMLEQRRKWLDQAGSQLTAVGLKLNEVTGYKEVERLKELVGEKETRLRWLRDDAKVAKEEYERAVTTRATTQSDVNSLLERKHAWSDEDVSRFTQLVRSDHTSNQAVTTTAATLKDTELAVDKAFNELMQAILQRYHEEQVWSDKIRNVSTYANLVGLLINLVFFVGAIAFVEPWKRRRLVERLEERIAGMMEHVDGSIKGLGAEMAGMKAQAAGAVVPETDVSTPPLLIHDAATPSPDSPAAPSSSTLLHPVLVDTMDRIWPLLDKVAPPSHDRDVVFSIGLGAATGIALTALVSMWLGR